MVPLPRVKRWSFPLGSCGKFCLQCGGVKVIGPFKGEAWRKGLSKEASALGRNEWRGFLTGLCWLSGSVSH